MAMQSKIMMVVITTVITTATWNFNCHYFETRHLAYRKHLACNILYPLSASWFVLYTSTNHCVSFGLYNTIIIESRFFYVWKNNQLNKSCVHSWRYQQTTDKISPTKAGYTRHRATNRKASFFCCNSSVPSCIRLAECDSGNVAGSLRPLETSSSPSRAGFIIFSTSQLAVSSSLMTGTFSERLTVLTCPMAGFSEHRGNFDAGRWPAKCWAWQWGCGALWHFTATGLMHKHTITSTEWKF